jgi:hypothetical protein
MRWLRLTASGVILAGLMLAADPEYFPLAVGNRWEYLTGGGGAAVAEVLGSEVIDGTTWFQVRWVNEKQVLLRVDEQRRLVELDRGQNKVDVWADFRRAGAAPIGTRVEVCKGGAGLSASAGNSAASQPAVPQVDLCRLMGWPYTLYQPSVGMVESGHGGDPGRTVLRLVRARIAGKDLTF